MKRSQTIANTIQNGRSEHDDSVAGQPLDVNDYCMSCTLVTRMLDGRAKSMGSSDAVGRKAKASMQKTDQRIITPPDAHYLP
jgi:hypothetical protein